MKAIQLQPFPRPGKILHPAVEEVAPHEVVGHCRGVLHPGHIRSPGISHWPVHSHIVASRRKRPGSRWPGGESPNTTPWIGPEAAQHDHKGHGREEPGMMGYPGLRRSLGARFASGIRFRNTKRLAPARPKKIQSANTT